jgi:hypothetical protein
MQMWRLSLPTRDNPILSFTENYKKIKGWGITLNVRRLSCNSVSGGGGEAYFKHHKTSRTEHSRHKAKVQITAQEISQGSSVYIENEGKIVKRATNNESANT